MALQNETDLLLHAPRGDSRAFGDLVRRQQKTVALLSGAIASNY